ncbi:amiloride-sensitive sodium channel subunit alpha-like [Centruroides sculpturatus]|uniref:amiloride-sensitive sodium channel subunit alpha-like n=1 Tax=Centruroides sculpturatus TaxID=218467 RepID=UPI000C6DBB2E|nr:amiloride-sensitive sodium channel subunit alpha-like [Centruroides sculpturatus]
MQEPSEKDKNTSIFEKFLGSSSVIGLSQITKSRSIVRKLLWLAVLVTGLTFCAIESHKFMREFYKYPVVVNLEIENKGALEFPAVTVCNLNSVRKSEYQKRFVKTITIESAFDSPFLPSAARGFFIPFRKFTSQCDAVEQKSRNENNQNDFYNTYFSLNKTVRGSLGHQKENFIMSSSFNVKQISLFDNFQMVVKPRHGPCYTFNGRNTTSQNMNVSSVRVSRNIGTLSGLTLVLNLELEEYFDKTKSVGARIVIHSPDEFPDTEGEGINILPGVETSIAINKQTTKRLPFPYKDRCKDYKKQTIRNVSILNEKDCIIHCLQDLNIQRCNCTDPTLIFKKKRQKCDLENNEEVCCLDKVFEEMSSLNFETCDCRVSCSITNYEMTTSMSLWPSPEEFQYNYQYYGFNYSSFRNTYAKLNVYYATLEETIYAQRPVYQNNEWYSHLGGQLGLWLGISLPAIFDCIETIVLLIHHAIIKYITKN